jgi:hypothetical protein
MGACVPAGGRSGRRCANSSANTHNVAVARPITSGQPLLPGCTRPRHTRNRPISTPAPNAGANAARREAARALGGSPVSAAAGSPCALMSMTGHAAERDAHERPHPGALAAREAEHHGDRERDHRDERCAVLTTPLASAW